MSSTVTKTGSPKTAITFTSTEKEAPHHDHCPLCVDSIVHPKGDKREPVIIFLETHRAMIPDVANPNMNKLTGETASKLFPGVERPSIYQWSVVNAHHIDPNALKSLNNLIERIEHSGRRALLVLNPLSRVDVSLSQFRENVYGNHDFGRYLCGKTAPEEYQAGDTVECKQGFEFVESAKKFYQLKLEDGFDVVEFWLKDHGFDLENTNFVVIDTTYMRGDRFGNRVVRTGFDLFDSKIMEKALEVLGLGVD